MSNSDNPAKGAAFEKQVKVWFEERYGQGFELKRLPIGKPPKDHAFDLVNQEKKVAIECKCFTWTETGNVPSAKMGFTNEAAFYLSFLPKDYKKYIVMLKSVHEKRNETLAEYYYRTYRHLLGDIVVAEFDSKTCDLKIIH